MSPKVIETYPMKELHPKTESELQQTLLDHNIPLDQWGVGIAKTVADLLTEIREGESTLKEVERELVRELRAVEIHVTHSNEHGALWKLFEEKQIFGDGRERVRNYPFSISGKAKKNEGFDKAFKREIKEELPTIQGRYRNIIRHREVKTISKTPNSYPSLTSHYQIHVFSVELTNKQFRPEGYVTHEPNLTTYFVWRKVV